jgi:hypothetical protein
MAPSAVVHLLKRVMQTRRSSDDQEEANIHEAAHPTAADYSSSSDDSVEADNPAFHVRISDRDSEQIINLKTSNGGLRESLARDKRKLAAMEKQFQEMKEEKSIICRESAINEA